MINENQYCYNNILQYNTFNSLKYKIFCHKTIAQLDINLFADNCYCNKQIINY